MQTLSFIISLWYQQLRFFQTSLGDVNGAVRILSSNSKVLEYSVEIINQLEDKHTDLHQDCAFLPPSEGNCSNSITVSVEDITESLKSFKNGTRGGPDGLIVPQHLQDFPSEALGETSKNTSISDVYKWNSTL